MAVWKEAAQETGFSPYLMGGLGRLLSLLGPRSSICQMEAILTLLPQPAERVKCDTECRVLRKVLATDAAWDGDHCCGLADEAAPNRPGSPQTWQRGETAWEHTAVLLVSHFLACSSSHQNTAARRSTSPQDTGK